ncbi:MAG: hypothetical protein QOK37_3969 [Thermoanaerobaculia bacterium]|jgi:hypothetical protein|nr:hypothetical protein [Thermoanaerobaculia bacterium]
MRFRSLVFALLYAAMVSAATPPPKKPANVIAPDTIPHPMAMYLGGLSKDGSVKVTFRASALGKHFFLEEPAGVTVYIYDETVGYRKETFLKGSTLAKAMKKYS